MAFITTNLFPSQICPLMSAPPGPSNYYFSGSETEVMELLWKCGALSAVGSGSFRSGSTSSLYNDFNDSFNLTLGSSVPMSSFACQERIYTADGQFISSYTSNYPPFSGTEPALFSITISSPVYFHGGTYFCGFRAAVGATAFTDGSGASWGSVYFMDRVFTLYGFTDDPSQGQILSSYSISITLVEPNTPE